MLAMVALHPGPAGARVHLWTVSSARISRSALWFTPNVLVLVHDAAIGRIKPLHVILVVARVLVDDTKSSTYLYVTYAALQRLPYRNVLLYHRIRVRSVDQVT